MPQAGPLSGITIIDLSRILAGPYCTLLLAELGARVIKVEAPKTGDDARQYGPFKGGKSTYFASVNRGKESIVLDLKAPADRDIFERLLDKADALVENFRPGTMEKLGYGWDSLHARYPRLIYAAASGFGHTGPYSHYPSYDMVVQGLGGIMSITGHPGMPLVRVGTSVGDLAGGLYTAIALNAALLHRERTGEATKVDVALFDCQLALLENAIMRYTTTGEIPGPMGARHPSITPFEAFRDRATATSSSPPAMTACSSSWPRRWSRPDLADNPLFKTNPLRNQHQEALKAEIEGVLRRRHDRALARRPRKGRDPVRPGQQCRAGAGPPADRGAQHAGRGRRPGDRALAARRQPDEILRLRRPADRATPPPTSTPTASGSCASWGCELTAIQ